MIFSEDKIINEKIGYLLLAIKDKKFNPTICSLADYQGDDSKPLIKPIVMQKK